MAVLPILTGDDNPILRTPAKPLERFTKDLQRLLRDMRETMEHAKGVGLAAPQIGVGFRVCIATIDGKVTPLINPEILSRGKETEICEEGCLSLPESWTPVPRATEIVVSYSDAKGKKKEKRLLDFNARVVQHELDHLDGKLIVDYAESIPRNVRRKDTVTI